MCYHTHSQRNQIEYRLKEMEWNKLIIFVWGREHVAMHINRVIMRRNTDTDCGVLDVWHLDDCTIHTSILSLPECTAGPMRTVYTKAYFSALSQKRTLTVSFLFFSTLRVVVVFLYFFSVRFFICDANEFYSDGRRKPNRLHGRGCLEVRVSGQKSCYWQKSARTPISLLLIDLIFPFHREVRGYLVRADQILQ